MTIGGGLTGGGGGNGGGSFGKVKDVWDQISLKDVLQKASFEKKEYDPFGGVGSSSGGGGDDGTGAAVGGGQRRYVNTRLLL